ncbi:MAG: MFS transporter [Oscillospiraceae bacterium]|nr:MFS transporter [Oscillospiraceae bacterium]
MSLKNKYNLLYFLYCIAGCCLVEFVTVFLLYRGVSNTQIGLVTGIGCVSTIFLSPYMTGLLTKYEKLNVKNVLGTTYAFMAAVFVLLAYAPLSAVAVMAGYTVIYCLYMGTYSFLQVMASDYTAAGMDINFGLARGLGSASWAVAALVLGAAVDATNPSVTGATFLVFTVLMLMLMKTMPLAPSQTSETEKGGSAISIIKDYPVYFLVLLGFTLCKVGMSPLLTYLPNIMTNLGGTTSMFGVAIFVMALSETPVMAAADRLMKKIDVMTLIVFGGIAYVVRNFIICFATNVPMLMVGMVFQGFSYGLLTVVVAYYAMYYLKGRDQAMGQTMTTVMTNGFGSTVGNIAGGVLQDTAGIGAMYVFACGATALGALIIIAAKIADRKKNREV